jgi:hypothetical protein
MWRFATEGHSHDRPYSFPEATLVDLGLDTTAHQKQFLVLAHYAFAIRFLAVASPHVDSCREPSQICFDSIPRDPRSVGCGAFLEFLSDTILLLTGHF